MKKIITLALTLIFTSVSMAQNTWEMTKEQRQEMQQKKAKPELDPKYGVGAVPVVNGAIVFEKEISAPGKNKTQIMTIVKDKFQEWIDEPNQILYDGGSKLSRISYDNIEEGVVAARFYEYLVFRNAALSLDRTDFDFQLIATCSDGKVNIKMMRMRYVYEAERPGGFNEPAEEIITDENCMNKARTKLNRMFGKFRKKTIDRKDYIFNELEEALK